MPGQLDPQQKAMSFLSVITPAENPSAGSLTLRAHGPGSDGPFQYSGFQGDPSPIARRVRTDEAELRDGVWEI